MKKKYADMDPLEEIRAIREEISGEFKTIRELGDYLRTNRSGARERAESPRNKTVAKPRNSGTSKSDTKGKAARHLTHA